MDRRMLLTAAAALAITSTARAQVGRPLPAPTPDYWVGLSYGLMELGTIPDGRNNATWDFGYTGALGASLEKSMHDGGAYGVEMSFASPHLNYLGSPTSFTCAGGCVAKANVTQILGTLRLGTSRFLYGSGFVLQAGVTQFADFKELSTSASLPGGGGWDATFGTGGNISFPIQPQLEAYLQTGLLYILHPQGSNVTNSPPINFTLKIGVRQGF